MEPCLCAWIDTHAEQIPDRVALIDDRRRVSYASLRWEMLGWAAWLEEVGVVSGARVAVVLQNRIDFIALQAACAHLGAIFVPLNTRLAGAELAELVANAAPTVLVYEETTARLAKDAVGSSSMPQVFDVDRQRVQMSRRAPTVQDCRAAPDATAMILYTSGSTGRPRGVELTHRNLWSNHRQFLEALPIGADDVNFCAAPLFHAAGLNTMTGPLVLAGGTTVLTAQFDPAEAWQIIDREQASCAFMVPAMWRALVEAAEERSNATASMRYGLVGGAPCPPRLIERSAARGITLMQGYGMTEAGPMGTLLGVDEAVEFAGSVGRPGFEVDLRIVDENGDAVGRGEVGQVVLRGPNVMRGYWHDAEATAQVLRDGWLHTGDLGRLDDAGRLHLCGRLDDMIITGGENVFPAEVERLLDGDPDIVEAAVFGVVDPDWGERVWCAVVPRAGRELRLGEVQERSLGSLARYKWPRRMLTLEALPRKGTGKVARAQLRQMARELS